VLQNHFKNKSSTEENYISENRPSLITKAYTTNSTEFGSFEPPSGEVIVISTNVGFINAGVINPNNPTEAYVLDNTGDFFSIDVATGVYTLVGNIPGDWFGAEYNPVNGIMYAIDDENLYSIDTVTITATIIGSTGLGGFPIALAIDGGGNAYTYDVVDDYLYSIDLNTGAATDIGPIGFDANFGQGMFWHAETDTMYMAAFNSILFEAELRSVNTTTGATIFISVLGDIGSLAQYGWASSGQFVPGPEPQIYNTWYLNFIRSTDIGTEYNILDIDPNINPFITISEDLTFTGDGACNSFNGAYVFNEPDLLNAFDDFNSTDLDCDFQIHNAFEIDLFNFISTEFWYEFLEENDGITLRLHNPLGGLAIFKDYPLSVSGFENHRINIYPNPVSNQLFITSENYEIETVVIYSAIGSKIIEIDNVETSIDVSHLFEGMYFIEVSTSEGKSVQKFIKK
jgi:hypothetical protein